MASSKLSTITNQIVGPAATDRFYIVEGIGGTPAEGYITFQDLQRQALGSRLYNGIITTSVSSNNLTVAIKTAAGTDPSSDNPVTALIGGSYYQITAALSITLNAGTNYWGNGVGYAKYYFVYLSYNSGVILGVGQMPYFVSSTGYNNTNTSTIYMARSTGTPSAVENIGMFKATLGTGASYNWSVDSTAVYQGPCYTTPVMAWLGTPSGVTLGTGGTSEAYYHIADKYQHFRYVMTLGSSGFSVTTSTIALPVARNGYPSGQVITVGRVTFATSGGLYYTGVLTLSSTTMTIRSLNSVGTAQLRLDTIGSSVPFTWAAGDKMVLEGSSFLGG